MVRAMSIGAETPAAFARWLRADARDVVRIRSVRAVKGARETESLADGLTRWRGRLGRRRGIAVVRRQLLVALGLAVVLEAIAVATGADLATRALWLAAPAAVAVFGVAIDLLRSPTVSEVARLLDHDLALAERVGTALEIDPGPPRNGGQPGIGAGPSGNGGLPAIVVAEATDAVSRSLAGARAALNPARREWQVLPALALVLAALVVVPPAGAKAHHAGAGHRSGARAHGRATVQVAATVTHSATAHRPPASTGRSHRPPALGFGNEKTPAGENRELARGPSAGKPSSGAPPKQLAHGGNGQIAPKTGAGAGQSGSSATGGSRAGNGGQANSKGGAGASAQRGAAAHGPNASRAATGARAGKVGSPNAPGQAGSASRSSRSAAAFRSRHAPPGGENAGHGRGSTAEANHPTVPKTVSTGAGLPIQSGYTPSATARASSKEGNGPAVSGGEGPARGGTAGRSGGSGAASFPYIPPSSSSLTRQNENLLLSYFGPFGWLSSASW